jgi:hypothetical protein
VTGFRIQDPGSRIQDSGFRIQDSGARSKQRTGAREDSKSNLYPAELAVAEKFRTQELRSYGKTVISVFFRD